MNEEARAAFVERLRARRIELGLRQVDVSRLLGVDDVAVNRWERQRRYPRVSRAQQWADVLGVRVTGGSLADLFPADRAPCGTPRGYGQHKRRGERCPECWAAWSAYVWALERRRLAGPCPVPEGRRRRRVRECSEEIVRMWGDGMSYAQIGQALGGVAKSSVRNVVMRQRAAA